MSINTPAIEKQFVSELGNSSKETVRIRLFWARKWLKFVGDKRPLSDWNNILVMEYQKAIEKEKYSVMSVRLALSVVKRVFDAARTVHEQDKNKLIASIDPNNTGAVASVLQAMSMPGPDWNLGRRFQPEAQENDISKPVMAWDDLCKLVKAGRAGKFKQSQGHCKNPTGVVETAFLGIASIYGRRCMEISAIHPEYINYDAGTIWLETEKHGIKRQHVLAPCLVPYLKDYDFKLEYSASNMNNMFHRICDQAGVKLQTEDRQAWHSIRRRVTSDIIKTFTPLVNETKRDPELISKIYTDWKVGSQSMPLHYLEKEQIEIDRLVLEHLPEVKLWE